MNNAAIIVFYRSTLPKLLYFFAAPHIKRRVLLKAAEEQVKVHFIHYPVLKALAHNRKPAKALVDLCLRHNISFLVGRNIQYYPEGSMPSIEGRITWGDTEEIRAIKDLSVLSKLSVERGTNLLKKNMCFIGETFSYKYISTMSEEAAGVIIYEHEKMDDAVKREYFDRLMAEKGISAAFTKNLVKAVDSSEIILADSTVELQSMQSVLAGKILIGENAVTGDFDKVSGVLLWYEDMGKTGEESLIAVYNNELMSILRHFNRAENAEEFQKRYICMDFLRNNIPERVLY